MRKLYLFILLLFVCVSSSFATHIVGGEIELLAIKDQANISHRVNLNLYFDNINGSVGAIDQNLTLGIFRKRDNFFMGYVIVPLVNSSLIPYTNPTCSQSNQVQTRLLQYSTLIYLNPDEFSDSQGYYIVWERCCRNNIISNIVLPQEAASVFYLSFPPLKKDGVAFVNSSPSFATLKGDYICLNRPFTFEFGATDADGDSLVYKLVTPLNGFSTKDIPNPALPRGSSNYPLVVWGNGYGLDNVMGGTKPLSVNPRTGQLTVTVNKEGLYVFCVLIEEYRKGVKIGEVRRDFQLKSLDCPINNAPSALFREKGKTEFYNSETTINIKYGEKKCLTLLGNDQDSNQSISMKVLPINSKFTPTLSTSVLTNVTSKDTLRTEICFNDCTESTDGKPLLFDVTVSDNGCPQPLSSTLRLKVFIEPKPNSPPTISTDLVNRRAEILLGNTLKFNLFGNDLDNDSITVIATGRGFNLAQAGMSFAGGSGIGKLTSPFTWTPICDLKRTTDYIVDFIVIDKRCGRNLRDSISVNLKPLSVKVEPPTVYTNLPNNAIDITINGTEPQPILFDVIGEEIDPKTIIKLSAVPIKFDLKATGMIWTDKSGTVKIVNPFSWKPDCSLLQGKDSMSYKIDFIVENNSCNIDRYDTVSVNIILKNKIASFDSFKPSNVFTPNGDGKNDYFSLDLPENSCFEQFESIEIFNRWGSAVFKSSDRNFKWTGDEFSSADYYYQLKFTQREFKGWVSLVR